jgi:hypothetical protein
MLTIRKEQLRFFSRESDEKFIGKMVDYVRSEFPLQFQELGVDGTRSLIEKVMALGLQHRIESPGAMAVLLQLSLMFGEKFEHSHEAAWANQMLATHSVPDTARMDMIRARLTSVTQGRSMRKFVPGAPAAD